MPKEYEQKVKEQYEYAKGNLDSLEARIDSDVDNSVKFHSEWHVFSQFLKTLFWMGFFYLWYRVLSTSMAGGYGGSLRKIEVKTAKDIEQKLDDVRGIDEIREEL